MLKRIFPFYMLVVCALLVGCKQEGHSSHHSLLKEIEMAPRVPVKSDAFKKVPPLAAKQFVLVNWEHPKRTFYTTKRKGQLKRFKCSGCHTSKITKRNEVQFKATHSDIVVQHAKKGVLQCTTCHDSSNMNLLRTPSGKKVSFDRSYELCSSCHSKRANDWAGGGHGKRIKYWAGQRAVKTCTSCHNPHKPLFGKRWPKTYFRLPTKKH